MEWKTTLKNSIDDVDATYLLAGAAMIAILLLATQTANSPVMDGTDRMSVLLTVDAGSTTDTQELVVSNNTTAFGVLEKNHDVTYEESSYGYFITGIDGTAMNDTHSWLFFVNGSPPSQSADSYVLSDADNVTFRFLSNEESKKYFE